MSIEYGYALSSEEFGPRHLVQGAVEAERAGFDYCSISDHFHPWLRNQGHSPFVWGVLGAIAEATTRIRFGTGVTCPLIRIHPSIVAHAAATASRLSDSRFFLGVGTGEALNEHILGDRWPPPETRLRMLDEAVQLIRDLWTGTTVDHEGEFYDVVNARLFDLPAERIPIIVSAFGVTAARLAGEIGDGLFGHGLDTDVVEAYEQAGGTGPRYAMIHLCYGPDVDECRALARDVWSNAAVPGQLSQDLPTWTHFEQAGELVSEDDVARSVLCGPDLDPIAARVQEYRNSGFDHVTFHQIGPHQRAFLDIWRQGFGADLAAA